jgi:hypothetical protein
MGTGRFLCEPTFASDSHGRDTIFKGRQALRVLATRRATDGGSAMRIKSVPGATRRQRRDDVWAQLHIDLDTAHRLARVGILA